MAETKNMLECERDRSARRNGLVLQSKLGVDPCTFGLVGSSDERPCTSPIWYTP